MQALSVINTELVRTRFHKNLVLMQKWNMNRKHLKVHERQLVSTCATAPVIAALQGCQYLFSKRGYNLAIFGDNIPKAQEKHKNTKYERTQKYERAREAEVTGLRRRRRR